MFRNFADQIDQQAKVASSLGLTYEQLGVLKDAAGYAGISVNQLGTALKKMSQGVADAATGTGEAKDALKELGLNAAQLEKMGPEKAFKAIIEKLDQIPNGIKKTQIAMKLFGRSGASMANLTSKGLKQAQKDADDLGIKLNKVQRESVEAANDAWDRIKIAAGDFLKYVTATIAPKIKEGLDSIFSFIKKQDLRKWAVTTALSISKAFQSVVIVLGAVGEGLIAVTRGLITAFKLANDVIKKYSDINYLASKGSVKIAEENIKNMKEQGVPENSYYYKKNEETLNAEREKLKIYQDMSYQASLIDESISDAAAQLNAAQGFSRGTAAEQAIRGLEAVVGELSTAQKKTADNAKEAGGTMKIAFSGTAEAAEIAGDKMARINAILGEMRIKANDAAAAIGNIPPMPDKVSIGGGPNLIDLLDRDLESAADR